MGEIYNFTSFARGGLGTFGTQFVEFGVDLEPKYTRSEMPKKYGNRVPEGKTPMSARHMLRGA